MLRTLFFALASLLLLLPPAPAPAAEAAKPPLRVAVVPMIPATAGALRMPGQASVAAADSVARALSQIPGVVVSSPTAVYHAVTAEGGNGGTTPAAVAKAARRVQAGVAVLINAVPEGRELQLQASFIAPDGQSAKVPSAVVRKGPVAIVTDYFTLHGEFAGAIISGLGLKPDEKAQARVSMALRPTASIAAYDHYILAKRQMPLASLEAMQDAVRRLDAAVKADGLFAIGRAALAEAAALLSMQQALTGLRDPRLTTLSVTSAEAAAKAQPDLPDTHRALALAYTLIADRRAAAKAEAALALQPDDPEAHLWLGVASAADGKKHITRALELDPSIPLGHLLLAVIALREDDPKTMQAECEKAITLCPTDPSPLLLIATVQTSEGNVDGAIATYSRLLRLNEKAAFAYAAVARLQYRQGKTKDAAAAMKQALALDPGIAQLVYQQASLAQEAKKWDEAEKEYKLILLANEKDGGSWRGLGTLALARNKAIDAEGNFKRALEANPGDTWSWVGVAQAYQRQGRDDAAEQALKAALNQNPEDGYVHLHLGHVYEKKRMLPQARDAYQAALQKSPLLAEAAFGLALVAQRLDPAGASRAWEAYLAVVDQAGLENNPAEQERIQAAKKQLGRP